MKKQTITVLGNCVAERLLIMLESLSGFSERYALKRFRLISHIGRHYLDQVARLALQCDVIFTQPLFNYGPCNTSELRKNLHPNQKMIVFSSPNFPAYFTDLCIFEGMSDYVSQKVLEWDSKIIFSCYLQGVSIFEVEEIYLSHWLFQKKYIDQQLETSVKSYLLRERGVDLSTKSFFFQNFTKTKLLHSPRHPVDSFLSEMFHLMVDALGLDSLKTTPEPLSFGFNQWPVISRHHNFFSFPEQNYFIVAGQRYSIEDIAMSFYKFYDLNPRVLEANRHHAVSLESSNEKYEF